MANSKLSHLVEKISATINNPDFPKISKIEFDLLLQNMRSLYEEVDTLTTGSSNGTNNNINKEAKVENNAFTKVIAANRHLLREEPLAEQKSKTPVVETVITAPVQNEVKATPVTKTNGANAVTINERIQTTGSLNEKLKTTSATEVHKKLAIKPLKDLIDLNKKFVLLNELFAGNTEIFTQAINYIDTLTDYDTAKVYVQSQLIAQYKWDTASQSARLFERLMKQKFGVD